MTSRLSMIAAILLLSATGALASTPPSSSDEARVLAGRSLPTSDVTPSVTLSRAPSSTDEARVLTGRSLPSTTSRPVLAFSGYPATTDEARALAAGGVRAVEPAGARKAAVACAQSCACKHG